MEGWPYLADVAAILILFIYGISVGSFLNVVADRVPAGKSIVHPRSHCFNCGHTLEIRDLIPIVSYLLLRDYHTGEQDIAGSLEGKVPDCIK